MIISGIKTCVLTNNWTNDTGKNFKSFLSLFHYFDEVFESCKLGLSKPDPDIYTHVCSKMNVRPSEVCDYKMWLILTGSKVQRGNIYLEVCLLYMSTVTIRLENMKLF